MNPYEPPRSESGAPWQPSSSPDAIVVRFPHSADQMIQSIDRFRALSSKNTQYLVLFARYARIVVVLLASCVLIYIALQRPVAPAGFRRPLWFDFAPVSAIVLLILMVSTSSLLSRWRLKRALARTQNLVGEVTFILSDSGVQVTYPNSETKLTWQAFTQAAAFDDGALLVQAPGFYWLPYNAIEGEYGQERMMHLLQAKVPKFIERRKSRPMA